MKAAVLGAGGQLGRALCAALPDADAFTRDELDIADADAVTAVDWSRYHTVFNAAAFTAVDAAETPDGRVAAWRANAAAVAHLARATGPGTTLVHVSTEYVFDGRHHGPIAEDAPLCPLSVYGASKAAGELAATLAPRHYVVRTSWVVGEGGNFVRTMAGLAAHGVSPSVVADQVGRLTFADDLARGLVRLAAGGAPCGTYHVTNSGTPTSWATVARAVFDRLGRNPVDVLDTTTHAYFANKPQAAARPLNSVLDLRKASAVGVELPPWPDALAEYLEKEATPR
ncbi:SDR family oxidoreductase [Pseudonocardia charpentierae]|uniref:dTDP-4-dehydrorhamnose reductase n=1 Tax=Pseudonocardia charpentierae TaxID=3075545 RepID=A0ABU2NHR4_9PSEU|nr:NAD(P)-dependent oxidoreductase [Pseudonocardia sp. DSM 45834]MDT0353496.1 NAD(P)-dependent oxidoreductase [Pseudonocardia sp. DSM 45834]